MKRILMLLAVLLSGFGCWPPDPEDIFYNSVWRIENATNQPLLISPPPYKKNTPYVIEPGKGVDFYSRKEYGYSHYLMDMMVCWRGRAEEEISFTIRDIDGTLLREWEYAKEDHYNPYSGRQFFNPYTWVYTYDFEQRRKNYAKWTFEILPEDIQTQSEP